MIPYQQGLVAPITIADATYCIRQRLLATTSEFVSRNFGGSTGTVFDLTGNHRIFLLVI
jgi:hypothetical protein